MPLSRRIIIFLERKRKVEPLKVSIKEYEYSNSGEYGMGWGEPNLIFFIEK